MCSVCMYEKGGNGCIVFVKKNALNDWHSIVRLNIYWGRMELETYVVWLYLIFFYF